VTVLLQVSQEDVSSLKCFRRSFDLTLIRVFRFDPGSFLSVSLRLAILALTSGGCAFTIAFPNNVLHSFSSKANDFNLAFFEHLGRQQQSPSFSFLHARKFALFMPCRLLS
jgi:hypothetical protein